MTSSSNKVLCEFAFHTEESQKKLCDFMMATNSFIAGGAALFWAMNESPPVGSDIDIWIPIPQTIKDGATDPWTDLIKHYFNAIIPNYYTTSEIIFDKLTPTCNLYSEWHGADDRFIHSIVNFTTYKTYAGSGYRKLQLIFVQVPDGKNAIDVIPHSFDLNICQFIVTPSKSGLFECKHAMLPKEEADELIKHRVFDIVGVPKTGKQVVNTMTRIEKYYKRGFSLATKSVVVKYEKLPVSIAGGEFYEKYNELITAKSPKPGVVKKTMKNVV